jgi:hypothetical protein
MLLGYPLPPGGEAKTTSASDEIPRPGWRETVPGRTLVIIGILVVIVLVIVGFLSRLARKDETDRPGYVFKECAACGWKGQVSKFHKKCSRCGDTLI